MYTLWSLVCLYVALSSALNLDLSLALSLDKRLPLRFMRRDIVYSNTTSPQLDLRPEVTTIASPSTSNLVLSETTSTPQPTVALPESTSPFSIADTNPSSATIAPFSFPPNLPPTVTSPSTIVPVSPPPVQDPRGSNPNSLTVATPSPPPIFGPSTPPETTAITSVDTSTISSSSSNVTPINGPAPPILKTPPPLPSFTRPFTNSSLSIDLGTTTNVSTTSPTCTGSVTYFGSVPPTVYVTVTEGFNVTMTASNASMTETPTLITPLPACQATIMPIAASYNPASSASGQDRSKTESNIPGPSTIPQFATNNPFFAPESSAPVVPGETPALASSQPPLVSASLASSAVYSSVDYTSTVVVTKKTPVPVVAPPTTSIDINFNFPSQNPTPPPSGGGNTGDSNSGDSGQNTVNNGGGGNSPSSNNAPVTPATNNGGSFPSISAPTGGSLIVEAPTTTRLGNIIASILNSPFATASPTSRASGAAPLTTTVNGVPIIVQPFSVVIGSQTVAIPNSAPTTVQASGAVFTVEPSKIIAPSTTITISQLPNEQIVTPVPTGTITTAFGRLTLTVGPTVAIISGTTYRVGQGAPATTVTVDGTRISIGSAGVGLPSTTVAPGGATPFTVYTVEGLTFSIAGTEAIVGGTTYRIGSNAPQLTTTIGSQHVSVSLGPGGVGLASTTLTPGGPTGSPFVVYTADGLTFSVDGSEAVVSGTTYRIGSNAPQVTTTIGSEHVSVSFGPGGIGLDSTTIVPQTTSSHKSTTESKTASATTSPTQSADVANDALSKILPASLRWCLFVLSLGWLVI
ncbi:hypothetical protein AYO20_00057 [Fonsecaea nubica]|uniref:Uncharacterized protein n=1 Tax=Fonsecaea nubica TaxID=856822 RepID=A0A178DGH9_9EURO|nr:hypothetical protein AYO20_00057 [Fonsecaea nubica]OAL40321.1 hypothetical protein AYO20_00057 [Fonsecaea nubica]